MIAAQVIQHGRTGEMMMCRMQVFIILAALATGPANAGGAGPGGGAELLAPFKRDLQQALKDGLAEGPEAAIKACKLKAPEIADALSTNGVRMGRTSERLRNPANVGPQWVGPILDAYRLDASNRQPRTVALGGSRSGYVEPIIVQPLCLTCHGQGLAPAISSRISQAYPQDQAVGYQVGDLRGVFWVEFPD